MTDRAPTSPKDKSIEALTTSTNEATLIVTINNVFPKETFEENDVENLKYRNLTNIPATRANKSIDKPSKKPSCIENLARAASRPCGALLCIAQVHSFNTLKLADQE